MNHWLKNQLITPDQREAYLAQIERRWRDRLAPPADVDPVEWCEANIILTRSSAAQGFIRFSKTPYLREIIRTVTQAIVVPGSGLVKQQAETEGLDAVFLDAGFEWHDAGCSMCVGINEDRLSQGERCASTSNRNFEGRQGPGARTHLASPAMVAAAAIAGCITDVRTMLN